MSLIFTLTKMQPRNLLYCIICFHFLVIKDPSQLGCSDIRSGLSVHFYSFGKCNFSKSLNTSAVNCYTPPDVTPQYCQTSIRQGMKFETETEQTKYKSFLYAIKATFSSERLQISNLLPKFQLGTQLSYVVSQSL